MKMNSLDEIAEILKRNDDFLILTHQNADGDTIGSAFALREGLLQLERKARVINNDEFAKKFEFITNENEEGEFEPKCIVSVDVADTKLLGDKTREIYGEKIDVCVDHHATNKMFARANFVDASSAACGEIIFALLLKMGVKITKKIADFLYTAICTDTGCFLYSNVTPKTHEIAAKLINFGADFARINKKMFQSKKMSTIRLQAEALNGSKMFFDGKMIVLFVTNRMLLECGCERDEIDSVIPLTSEIEGVLVGATFKEGRDGKIKLSLRTGENVDASEICKAFGGGGHMRAAGCSFETSFEKSLSLVLKYVKDNIFRGENYD